jgi:hypothetical protein
VDLLEQSACKVWEASLFFTALKHGSEKQLLAEEVFKITILCNKKHTFKKCNISGPN